jgi:diguanylate cyclase (GGDEF)-like protein
MELQSKQALKVLDSESDERFDRYTRLACKIFDVPIALVSLIDRERRWFQSEYGIEVPSTLQGFSFCGLEMSGDEVLVVPDVRKDERFRDRQTLAMALNLQFYAACPLQSPSGEHLGSLCLIDHRPRDFSPDDADKLKELGHLVEAELSSSVLATTDDLTRIANRRGFIAVATHALAACVRMGHPATLVLFDLDGFKAINDDLGHDVGDQALFDFARALLKTFRESDVVARLGGDEFCALLSPVNPDAVGRSLARLDESLAQRNRGLQENYCLRYSAGIVNVDGSKPADLDELLREADQLMYKSKRAKRSSE